MNTFNPLCFNILPKDAAVKPFPRPDTTPPVTNMNFAILFTSFSILNKKAPTEDPFVPFKTIANSPVVCNSFLYFIN